MPSRRNPAAEKLGYVVVKKNITFKPPESYNRYEYYDILDGVVDTSEAKEITVTVFVLEKKEMSGN